MAASFYGGLGASADWPRSLWVRSAPDAGISLAIMDE